MHDKKSNYTLTHTYTSYTSYTHFIHQAWIPYLQEKLLPLLPPHRGAEGEAKAQKTSRTSSNGEMAEDFRLVKYNPDGSRWSL